MSRVGTDTIKFGQCSPAQKTLLIKCFKCFFEFNEEDVEDYLFEYIQTLINDINQYYKIRQKKMKKIICMGENGSTLTDLLKLDSAKYGSVSFRDNKCTGNSRNVISINILNELNMKKSPLRNQAFPVSEKMINLNLKGLTNIYIVEKLLEYFEDIGI